MIALLGARILPHIFNGLTKNNICREAAKAVGGKWDGTALRYERAAPQKGSVFDRKDAKRIAMRSKNQQLDKSQIKVIRNGSPLPETPLKERKKVGTGSLNFFTDYGVDNQYRHAPTVPLHEVIAKLDLPLVTRAQLSSVSSKSGNGVKAVSLRQDVKAAPLEKGKPRRQEFFEEMVGKRRALSKTFATKFSLFMEKSGKELDAAASSCDSIYQEIYTKEFNWHLDKQDAGKILEYTLRSAHAMAARVAVERMGGSGSMDHRNYAKFLSAFRLVYVRNSPPPIPPRTGAVAYRGGA